MADIALIFLDQMGSLILNPQIPADLCIHWQNIIEAAFPRRKAAQVRVTVGRSRGNLTLLGERFAP